MSDDFLSRWSRRKHAARRDEPLPEPAPPAAALPASAASAPVTPAPPPLPPVESLTPESDFAPFMQAEVDPATRRDALKKLFSDPQFNVMDGLDVYIDDYSKPDPLPEGWLAKMNQVARLGDYIAPPENEAEAPPPAAIAEAPTEPAVNPDSVAAVEPDMVAADDDSLSESEAIPSRKG